MEGRKEGGRTDRERIHLILWQKSITSSFVALDLWQYTSRAGEGNSNPLQCSCLENPRDGGAWWAAVYGVAQSQTRLKRLSSSTCEPGAEE